MTQLPNARNRCALNTYAGVEGCMYSGILVQGSVSMRNPSGFGEVGSSWSGRILKSKREALSFI